jgi:hypothetical protein
MIGNALQNHDTIDTGDHHYLLTIPAMGSQPTQCACTGASFSNLCIKPSDNMYNSI